MTIDSRNIQNQPAAIRTGLNYVLGADGNWHEEQEAQLVAGLLPTLGYYLNYDTGNFEVVSGGNTSPEGGGGGGSAEPPLQLQPYQDDSYTYLCFSAPGIALSASSWRVTRYDFSGYIPVVRYANGTYFFDKAATDLATVQGYSY